MTTKTETENHDETSEKQSRADALDWAVFGCVAAGGVGIYKACEMSNAVDVLICLLGSVIAFGVVFYVHLRKH